MNTWQDMQSHKGKSDFNRVPGNFLRLHPLTHLGFAKKKTENHSKKPCSKAPLPKKKKNLSKTRPMFTGEKTSPCLMAIFPPLGQGSFLGSRKRGWQLAVGCDLRPLEANRQFFIGFGDVFGWLSQTEHNCP